MVNWSFTISLILFFVNSLHANLVEHKNLQLNLYLDLIKYNTHEKLGVLQYVLENPQGAFLEVGTGGDPIADLLEKIPSNLSPVIIASDIDPDILKLLPIRHPKLNKYLNRNSNAKGPILKLQQLDATCMAVFKDNYLSGINASAVAHEVISYAGGQKALNKFFAEAARVIKPGGVLIYRDPESVLDAQELINVSFKNRVIRLFVHIFLVKFLDTHCSQLALSNRKYQTYNTSLIKFTCYRKNENIPICLTYEQYLKLKSHEIDFDRLYTLCLPRGLCREIERHYLTYLHQCNPLVFIKCLPTIDSKFYFVNYLAHSTRAIFDDFLIKNDFKKFGDLIDNKTYKKLLQNNLNHMRVVEDGILLRFDDKTNFLKLADLLQTYHLDPNFYIIKINQNKCVLDYRVFGLLYDQINNAIFDMNNGPVNDEDLIHAHWLKREGEETYTYYSDDVLIAKVAEASWNTTKDGYILCPISSEHNQFISRQCYNELLKDSLEINDMFGYRIKIKEGKRIIHFKKLKIQEALIIYRDIVHKKPTKYQALKKFLNSEMMNV